MPRGASSTSVAFYRGLFLHAHIFNLRHEASTNPRFVRIPLRWNRTFRRVRCAYNKQRLQYAELQLNLTGRDAIVAIMVKSTTFPTYSKKLIKNTVKLIFPEKLSDFCSNYCSQYLGWVTYRWNIFGKEREDFCGRISQRKPVTKASSLLDNPTTMHI